MIGRSRDMTVKICVIQCVQSAAKYSAESIVRNAKIAGYRPRYETRISDMTLQQRIEISSRRLPRVRRCRKKHAGRNGRLRAEQDWPIGGRRCSVGGTQTEERPEKLPSSSAS